MKFSPIHTLNGGMKSVLKFHPSSHDEAVSGLNSEQWKMAISKELLSHEKNKTWVIIPHSSVPVNQRILTSR